MSARVDRVHVTETISYNQGTSPPVVTQSVSGGRLSLSDPACPHADCNVDFDVTVPADVTVTASTGGGPLSLRGVSGSLRAETDGGPLIAQDIAAATATITTGGGPAMVTFTTAPEKVSVGTDGGPAT